MEFMKKNINRIMPILGGILVIYSTSLPWAKTKGGVGRIVTNEGFYTYPFILFGVTVLLASIYSLIKKKEILTFLTIITGIGTLYLIGFFSFFESIYPDITKSIMNDVAKSEIYSKILGTGESIRGIGIWVCFIGLIVIMGAIGIEFYSRKKAACDGRNKQDHPKLSRRLG